MILDSIASLAKFSTNIEEAWLPIIEWFVELRCKGICVVYLQQAGKSGEQRGHSVSEDRIDLAVHLTARRNPDGGAAFKMTFTKQREGSLQPLCMKCTNGTWEVDVAKQEAEQPTDRRQEIVDALSKGESYKSISERLKVARRNISQIKKETTNHDHSNANVSS